MNQQQGKQEHGHQEQSHDVAAKRGIAWREFHIHGKEEDVYDEENVDIFSKDRREDVD
jgi:hypothetical protein